MRAVVLRHSKAEKARDRLFALGFTTPPAFRRGIVGFLTHVSPELLNDISWKRRSRPANSGAPGRQVLA
jgi:hypothetical protein